MKILFKLVLFVSLICVSGTTFAKYYSSEQIKRFVNKTPREAEVNISKLVYFLTKPFDNDYDKAKAIAFWIASHISYDEYLYNNGGATKLRYSYFGQKPKDLLQSRVGICGDFADLFEEMCRRAGIRTYTIRGFAYPSNVRLTTSQKRSQGHVWNYFIFDNKKIFVDTTFMADGKTGVRGSGNSLNRNRALRKIKNSNKRKSNLYSFDDFYFDFKYKEEKKQRGYIREER